MSDDPNIRPDVKKITSRQRHDFNTRCGLCQAHGEYYIEGAEREYKGQTLPFFVCKEHARID